MHLDQSDTSNLPDDLLRLMRKLKAPQAPPPIPPHAVQVASDLALLGGILDEIDETVMARRLNLENADGATLTLDVCNRRLLQVISEDARGAKSRTMTARDLTYAGANDLKSLHDMMIDFSAAAPLIVRSRAAGNTATLEDTGLAATTLRSSWDKPSLHSPDEESAMALLAFCDEVSPIVTAWIYDDPQAGDDAQAVGDDDAVERLTDVMSHPKFNLLATGAAREIRALAFDDPTGGGANTTMLVLARAGKASAAMLVDPENLSALLDRAPW